MRIYSAATYDATAIENAAVKYAYAFNNEMAAKVKAVSETDKAAIEALGCRNRSSRRCL